MPRTVRQRQEGTRVKRTTEQRSNSVKVAALQMKKAKVKTKDICKELNIPKNTFNDWVRAAKNAGTLSDVPGEVSRPAPRKKDPGTGTKNRKITDDTKMKMKRLVKKDPFVTAKQIKTKILALKDVTAQRINQVLSGELGLKSFVAPKKPQLTPDQIEYRDDWGHFHKKRTRKWWNGVLFSDETHIEIWRDTYRTRKVRRSLEDNKLDPKFTRKTIKHPLKLMAWGCFGNGRLGDLVIVPDKDDEDGNKRSQKRCNQYTYRDILEEHLRPSMERTGTKRFVQDNATCHTAKSMRTWFKENSDIEVIDWPPQSADMNPIENAWDLLKHEMGKLPVATSREQLKTRITQAWAALGERKDVLKSLCDSMPRRIEALVAAEGGNTKY